MPRHIRSELAEIARELKALARWQQETGTDKIPADRLTTLVRQPPPDSWSEQPETPAAISSTEAPDGASASELLEQLRSETIGECQRCKLCDGRQNIVFGVGSPAARVMFVGEGPGADEDRLGEPFVGRAGQLLNRIISAMSLSREEVYIANIVKCRPPRNRDPEPDEVEACEPFLQTQIRIIRPEVIIALGRVAAVTLLRDDRALRQLRGHWHSYEGIPLIATYHPAFLLRSPNMKRACWEDIQLAMERLGLERPVD